MGVEAVAGILESDISFLAPDETELVHQLTTTTRCCLVEYAVTS